MNVELNNLDHFLGKKIRLYRHKMNWPLKVMAGKLGISLQQIQRYEEGKNKISASLLFKLANELNIPIANFFEGYLDGQQVDNPKSDTFNILLIEDNLQDEFIFRKSLENFPRKLNVTTINDGKQALEYFKNINDNAVTKIPKPELIMLDLNLPDMQGFEILRDLKRKPAFRNIPVIVLTNSLNSEDVISSYNLQASGFIRKSFSYKDFKDNCFKVLSYWSDTVTLPH